MKLCFSLAGSAAGAKTWTGCGCLRPGLGARGHVPVNPLQALSATASLNLGLMSKSERHGNKADPRSVSTPPNPLWVVYRQVKKKNAKITGPQCASTFTITFHPSKKNMSFRVMTGDALTLITSLPLGKIYFLTWPLRDGYPVTR